MELLGEIVWYILVLTVIHEMGHYIVLNINNKFNRFNLTWYGIEAENKFPIPIKVFIFCSVAGLIFSGPSAIALNIFYNSIWPAIIWFSLGLLDIALFLIVVDAKLKNPFLNELTQKVSITISDEVC